MLKNIYYYINIRCIMIIMEYKFLYNKIKRYLNWCIKLSINIEYI